MTVREFPLAWRWTQPSHSVLPPHALEDILPLGAAEAERISRTNSSGRAPSLSYSTSEADAEQLSRWLRRIQPDLQARVYVSWTKDWAIETSWDIFAEYWDDFCYPSSDDVTIVPVNGAWQLMYQHEESFQFFA